MKLPLPLEIVKGRYPVITQEFGNTSNNEWYIANGIKFDATSSGGHNGTDIVIGGGKNQNTDTYGTKLVCPTKALLNKVWYTEPLSTKGNGVKVQWSDPRGTVKMVVWHCSECPEQQEYQDGDTLGYIGNSGLVSPIPNYFSVHAGSHLHLGTCINDVSTNPREIFDFTKWYVSEIDTGIEKDLHPFQYFLNKIIASFKII